MYIYIYRERDIGTRAKSNVFADNKLSQEIDLVSGTVGNNRSHTTICSLLHTNARAHTHIRSHFGSSLFAYCYRLSHSSTRHGR